MRWRTVAVVAILAVLTVCIMGLTARTKSGAHRFRVVGLAQREWGFGVGRVNLVACGPGGSQSTPICDYLRVGPVEFRRMLQ